MNNYVNGALNWVKKHPVQAGAVATAGAALAHTAMNPQPLDTYPLLRFGPYFANSLACAELNAQRMKNEKGRELTFGERMASYLYGSITPMILWEGWEEAGATEPVYKVLRRAFGDMAKQDFEGKGSFIDLGLTVGAVMAVETAKEGITYLSNLAKRRQI